MRAVLMLAGVLGAFGQAALAQEVAPARAAIEACVGFVTSDAHFEFGPDWVDVKFTREMLLGRDEVREDLDLVFLRGGLEIAADSRVDRNTGDVIDRQCLVMPFEAGVIARLAEGLEGV